MLAQYLINSAGIASWDGLQDVTEKEMLEVFRHAHFLGHLPPVAIGVHLP